jgi:hypothetical protein
MAVRMQQRRATALQWLEANPILEPGEIGFETDTVAFKIGDGINTWDLLDYFEPTASLDLAGTLGDYVLLVEKGNASGVATLDETGNVPLDQLGNVPEADLTGYATETFVNTAVSNLVDAAPGALDTLNELAAALNDDANFATTITSAIADKADASHTHAIADITDFEILSPVAGQTITYNGTKWVNSAPASSGFNPFLLSHM